MSDAIETHRSFVNTWECDENRHMNVQFYAKRFEEALAVFALLGGSRDKPPMRCLDRHLRFHVELHEGATTVTRSAVVSDGPFAGRVVHRLYHAETGVLCATALDMVEGGAQSAIRVDAADVAAALPRSIGSGRLEALAPQILFNAGGSAANFSVLNAADCDAAGGMSERAVVGRFSDGAPHAWKSGGLDVSWLRERQFGRVAVEMKITRHGNAGPGDVVALYSALVASTGKTVSLRHELVRLASGEPVASGKVTALILDLRTRRPAALPESVAARMQDPDAG